MNNKFSDQSANIIVIEPASSVRQLIIDVIKSAGFKKIQGMPTIKDALNLLETDSVDWIITPVMPDADVNAFHLLKIIVSNQNLNTTRVSLFIDESTEQKYIPELIELGMLSWLDRPNNKDAFTFSFNEFIKLFKEFEWDCVKLSAHLFLNHLQEKQNFATIVSLTQNLLKVYSGDLDLMFRLPKALKEIGKIEESKQALQQILIINEKKLEQVKKLSLEIYGTTDLNNNGKSTTNLLGLKKVVIIDSDPQIRSQLIKILDEVGCEQTIEFSDGKSAWNWFEQAQDDIDFIFQEWAIPQLSGPFLIQRIRAKYPLIPIIIVSSLIQDADLPLLSEMGIAGKIDKPIVKEIFIKKVIHYLRQEKIPTEVDVQERKIRQYLTSGQKSEADQIYRLYLNNVSVHANRKIKIEAEYAFFMKDYEIAKTLSMNAIKVNPDTLQLLNLLGRCLLYLGDYAAALKCLETAQNISPKNIARLCLIAEVKAEQSKIEDALEDIELGKRLDKENETLKQGEAKVYITSGESEMAKKFLSTLAAIKDVISYMNNKAVSLAKCKKFDEGIEEYHKTVASIPDDRLDLKATVLYNLALAFARIDKLEEAAECLKDVLKLEQERIKPKAKSLLDKINRSLKAGQSLILNSAEEPTNKEETKATLTEMGAPDSTLSTQPQTVLGETRAFDCCLYSIFINDLPKSDQVIKWLNNLPRYTARNAIEKKVS